MNTIAQITQIIQNLSVIAVSIVGGIWVVFRLKRERTYEGALRIEVSANVVAMQPRATFVSVILTNQGHTKLQANEGTNNGPIYSDRLETIRYSCSLEIKKVNADRDAANQFIDWYSSSSLALAIPEVNLLSGYENPDKNGRIEFWMEPGETYRLGSLMYLVPGLYLAKVTFIGVDSTEDFWTQIDCFEVPTT